MPATAEGSISRCANVKHSIRPWRRGLLCVCAGSFALAIAVEAGRVLLGNNLHAVIPGRVYRCSQQSPEELEQLIRTYGIRTVINLRGCCPTSSWYLDECRVTHALDVAQEDVAFSAGRFPPTHEMRRLVEVIDRTAYPVLIHCRQGADRTGLAAAALLLLQPDLSFAQARRQLSLRFGHIALGRPGNLDRYLDLYAAWLAERGLSHSSSTFRHWLAADSCPGDYRCVIEPLSFPDSVPMSKPFALHIRAHNTGSAAWRFQPETHAGIHASCFLQNAEGRTVHVERAGLFDAEVLPGQSIDLTLAFPPIGPAGSYRLLVDMIDEPHCIFFQAGSEPLDCTLTVR